MLLPLSQHIWQSKYRFTPTGGQAEASIEQTWARVAKAVAQAEPSRARAAWQKCFLDSMAGFEFIPAGRILAGAGTDRAVTLFNCFVMGEIGDDMGSIFTHLREAALTLQQGGGIGHDFSTLRPKGALVRGVGAEASGPVSFMDVWDAMCRTIMSAGARRGAMMGTLTCDHPDIELFIEAKADPARMRNFNISVLVTDAFLEAVKADEAWPLGFGGKVYKSVSARGLWHKIMRSAYDYAEPGVIFIDRVNALNNLNYCEHINATNPCGEQPLPPYGACLLGSINLAALIEAPFTPNARLKEGRLAELVPVAVRFLDDVIEVSRYPLPAQEAEAKAKRRIGLGVTGLADALAFCGVHYGSEEGRKLAARWMGQIANAAYLASCELAREKGSFPLFDAEKFAARPFLAKLGEDVRGAVARLGIRNGVLISIAPTGTISLLAGNVSSGIEPIFDYEYSRRILEPDGEVRTETVQDFAVRLCREQNPQGPLPPAFVSTHELSPKDHLLMQAAVQEFVDASISKTVNCPKDMTFEAFEDLYLDAHRLGLKGCTAYRPNEVTGAVLVEKPKTQGLPSVPAQTALPLASVPQGAEQEILTFPMVREPVLSGFTYKIKWPPSDHALYITINDRVENGVRRPFEIFINSKSLEHYAFTVALTRMISAVFRRGGDISFVAEELKAVFDPRGGAWMEGVYVPSLLAAIGNVIEKHLAHIGFNGASRQRTAHLSDMMRLCPRCSAMGLIFQEGCAYCRACGYSSCG